MSVMQGLNAVQLVLDSAIQGEITLATFEFDEIVATAPSASTFIPEEGICAQNLYVPSVAVVIESPR